METLQLTPQKFPENPLSLASLLSPGFVKPMPDPRFTRRYMDGKLVAIEEEKRLKEKKAYFQEMARVSHVKKLQATIGLYRAAMEGMGGMQSTAIRDALGYANTPTETLSRLASLGYLIKHGPRTWEWNKNYPIND